MRSILDRVPPRHSDLLSCQPHNGTDAPAYQFFNLLAQNTDNVEILCTVVNLVCLLNPSPIILGLGALAFGFAVFNNPNLAIFLGLAVIGLAKRYNTKTTYILALTTYLGITMAVIIGSLYASAYLTGGWV